MARTQKRMMMGQSMGAWSKQWKRQLSTLQLWILAAVVVLCLAVMYALGVAAGEQQAHKDTWVLQEDGTFTEWKGE